MNSTVTASSSSLVDPQQQETILHETPPLVLSSSPDELSFLTSQNQNPQQQQSQSQQPPQTNQSSSSSSFSWCQTLCCIGTTGCLLAEICFPEESPFCKTICYPICCCFVPYLLFPESPVKDGKKQNKNEFNKKKD